MSRLSAEEWKKREKAKLLQSFKEANGGSFNHFFCPMLWADEDVELLRGHVFNQSFGEAKEGKTVLQRCDTDQFFAKHFEDDVISFVESLQLSKDEFLKSKYARDIEVYVDNVPQKTFVHKGQGLPLDKYGLVPVGDSLVLAVEYPDKELKDKFYTGKAMIRHIRDWRITNHVTVLKAAHLTLFHIFKYKYGLSTAGDFLGRRVLGAFYQSAKHLKSNDEVRQAAKEFFTGYIDLVRPLLGIYSDSLELSINRNRFFFIVDDTNEAFALGVVVKTGRMYQMVIVPNFLTGHARNETFYKFLSHDNGNARMIPVIRNVDTDVGVIDGGMVKIDWRKCQSFDELDETDTKYNNPADHFTPFPD